MTNERNALPLAVSVQQASYLLGISERLAWDLVKAGVIPSTRLGRRVVVATSDLAQLLGLGREVDGDV